MQNRRNPVGSVFGLLWGSVRTLMCLVSLVCFGDSPVFAESLPAPASALPERGAVGAVVTGVAGVDTYLNDLITRCAPTVHPETMAAVISAESRGHQFAIADAGPLNLPWSQRKHLVRSFYFGDIDSAAHKAAQLISDGHTVSLGLSQINDRNLAAYGMTIRAVFDPCTNVSVGGKILTDFYLRAVKQFGQTPAALHAAISAYNSGDWVRGAKDGYVNLVYQQRGKPLALNTKAVLPSLTANPVRAATGGAETVKWKPQDLPLVVHPKGFTMSARTFAAND